MRCVIVARDHVLLRGVLLLIVSLAGIPASARIVKLRLLRPLPLCLVLRVRSVRLIVLVLAAVELPVVKTPVVTARGVAAATPARAAASLSAAARIATGLLLMGVEVGRGHPPGGVGLTMGWSEGLEGGGGARHVTRRVA